MLYHEKLNKYLKGSHELGALRFLESLNGIEWMQLLQSVIENKDPELLRLVNKNTTNITTDISVLINLLSPLYQHQIPDALYSLIVRNIKNIKKIERLFSIARLTDQMLPEGYILTSSLNPEVFPRVRAEMLRYLAWKDRKAAQPSNFWYENYDFLRKQKLFLNSLFLALYKHDPVKAISCYHRHKEVEMEKVGVQLKKTIRELDFEQLKVLSGLKLPERIAALVMDHMELAKITSHRAEFDEQREIDELTSGYPYKYLLANIKDVQKNLN